MNIDDKMIEKLIEKEIKSQVGEKLKNINRNTIIRMYEEAIYNIVKEVLVEKTKEMENILINHLKGNIDSIEKEITNQISSSLVCSIRNAFIEGSCEDDDFGY